MKKISLSVLMAIASYTSFSQSLVAHWTFDNGTANDISGNSLNGITSNTTAAAGKGGVANTALQFNGSTSKVDVAYNSLMNLEQFTVMATIKPTGFNSDICQGNIIIDRYLQSANNYQMIFSDNYYDNNCNVQTPNKNCFASRASGTETGSPSVWQATPINLNQWYCVVMVYNKTDLKLYVDNVLTATMPYNHSFTPSTAPLSIGYAVAGLPNNGYFFNGIIDDIQLWDGPLTAAAIASKCADAGSTECKIDDISVSYGAVSTKNNSFKAVTTNTSANVKWTFGDGTTQTASATQTVSHTYPSAGQYAVCAQLIVNNTDCGEKACFDVCVSGSSLKVANLKNEKIADPYPNPANSQLNVPVRVKEGKVSVTLISIDGKRLAEKSQTLPDGDNTIDMSLDNIVPGVYMIEIKEGNERRFKSFSKQ